jgi:hypothetical protein
MTTDDDRVARAAAVGGRHDHATGIRYAASDFNDVVGAEIDRAEQRVERCIRFAGTHRIGCGHAEAGQEKNRCNEQSHERPAPQAKPAVSRERGFESVTGWALRPGCFQPMPRSSVTPGGSRVARLPPNVHAIKRCFSLSVQ